jgi:hypothetical protein
VIAGLAEIVMILASLPMLLLTPLIIHGGKLLPPSVKAEVLRGLALGNGRVILAQAWMSGTPTEHMRAVALEGLDMSERALNEEAAGR